MLVKCHLLAFVREVSIYRNQELDSVVQYARIETCDESIGSLEPFALRRSTLDCNAGADLDELCEPAHHMKMPLSPWSMARDFLFSENITQKCFSIFRKSSIIHLL